MTITNFGGVDPLLLLNKKHNANLTQVTGLNPILKMAGFSTVDGAPQFLNFSMQMELPNRPARVVMVGCGGTGSHLLPNILQYLSAEAFRGRPMPEIILIDGDTVEQKNLVRQKFTSGDLGMNKAAALARRYSGAFGTKISVFEGFLEDAKTLLELAPANKFTLVIGAVDNHRARLIIWDYYNQVARAGYPIAWVDTGNESWHGQAILGLNTGIDSRSTLNSWDVASIGQRIRPINLPTFFDVYPDEIMRIGSTPLVPQNDCAQMVEENPQTIQANMMSSFCGTSLCIQVLSGVITSVKIAFDAQSGNTTADYITKISAGNFSETIEESERRISKFLVGLDLGKTGYVYEKYPWLNLTEN